VIIDLEPLVAQLDRIEAMLCRLTNTPAPAAPPKWEHVVLKNAAKGQVYACLHCDEMLAPVSSSPPIADADRYWAAYHKPRCSAFGYAADEDVSF